MECIHPDINVSHVKNSSNEFVNTYSEPNDTVDYSLLADQKWFAQIELIIDKYIIHYICLFGIIGNLMNLMVLTRKSLSSHMERLEKSAHVGLIALAVSDLLLCTWTFPHAWLDPHKFASASIDFWLVYTTYKDAIINSFLLSSSWLTVTMAVCRYLAICHPLRARQYLGMSATRLIIIVVFILSILFNLPRFWMKRITYIECMGGGRSYFNINGPMETNKVANITYMWFYFIFAIFMPLSILAYCNVYLVKALRLSGKLRQQHSNSRDSDHSRQVVTMTLSIIVVLYIVLVGPAELLTFWKPFVADTGNPLHYGLASRICNSLQALNFAINFILYCVINVHFRKVIKELLLCHLLRDHIHPRQPQVKTTSIEMSTHDTGVML